MYSFTLPSTSALVGGWVVNATPRPLYPPGKTRYPLYRRLGGPQGRSGRVRKITPPTGIRSPDRPTCSELLYRLSYRGSPSNETKKSKIFYSHFPKKNKYINKLGSISIFWAPEQRHEPSTKLWTPKHLAPRYEILLPFAQFWGSPDRKKKSHGIYVHVSWRSGMT